MSINPKKADVGRRVFHRIGWKGSLVELGSNPTMVRVKRDDGLVLYALKANLYWDMVANLLADDPNTAALASIDTRADDDNWTTAGEAAMAVADTLAQSFTDADTNTPDSFSGDGGSFGGGGDSGSW